MPKEKVWEFWERNNGSFGNEHRYTCGAWQITLNTKTNSGYIGKSGRVTVIESFEKGGSTIEKGFGIPNFVVDKVNEIIKS